MFQEWILMNKKLTLAHPLPPYFDLNSCGSPTHEHGYVLSLLGYNISVSSLGYKSLCMKCGFCQSNWSVQTEPCWQMPCNISHWLTWGEAPLPRDLREWAMQHLSLEVLNMLNSARQCFHYYVRRGHPLPIWHPEKPHIYLPKLNLWALLWLSYKRPEILLLIPATFTAFIGELGDRETDRKHHGFAFSTWMHLPSIPRAGLLSLRKNIKTTAETVFLNSSAEKY